MIRSRVRIYKTVYEYNELKQIKKRKESKMVSIYHNNNTEKKLEIDRKTKLYQQGLL